MAQGEELKMRVTHPLDKDKPCGATTMAQTWRGAKP